MSNSNANIKATHKITTTTTEINEAIQIKQMFIGIVNKKTYSNNITALLPFIQKVIINRIILLPQQSRALIAIVIFSKGNLLDHPNSLIWRPLNKVLAICPKPWAWKFSRFSISMKQTQQIKFPDQIYIFNTYQIYISLQRWGVKYVTFTIPLGIKNKPTNPTFYLLSCYEDPNPLKDKGLNEIALKSLHARRIFH